MEKFKVGDKVRVINKTLEFHKCASCVTRLDYFILRKPFSIGNISWYAFDIHNNKIDACHDHDMTENDIELYDLPRSPFKVGDRVEVLSNYRDPQFANKNGKIVSIINGGDITVEMDEDIFLCHDANGMVPSRRGRYFDSSDLVLVTDGKIINNNNQTASNSTTNNMENTNPVEIYKNSKMEEPQKALFKAGVITDKGELTSQGQQLFQNWLLEQNMAAFLKDMAVVFKKEDKKGKTQD